MKTWKNEQISPTRFLNFLKKRPTLCSVMQSSGFQDPPGFKYGWFFNASASFKFVINNVDCGTGPTEIESHRILGLFNKIIGVSVWNFRCCKEVTEWRAPKFASFPLLGHLHSAIIHRLFRVHRLIPRRSCFQKIFCGDKQRPSADSKTSYMLSPANFTSAKWKRRWSRQIVPLCIFPNPFFAQCTINMGHCLHSENLNWISNCRENLIFVRCLCTKLQFQHNFCSLTCAFIVHIIGEEFQHMGIVWKEGNPYHFDDMDELPISIDSDPRLSLSLLCSVHYFHNLSHYVRVIHVGCDLCQRLRKDPWIFWGS